ncbi:hypothetical protein BDZ91DRAFT_721254 [Kalaharituber pfeilii]|nr:hypothetical protein BDZ91DRAFT_721254 [Kalaharituber pfeilii]
MASSPQSPLSSADSDIEPPPPRPASTGTKRAASIAFSDHSPTSTHHPRRRPQPPQPPPLTFHDYEDHPHIHQHATSLSDVSSDTSGSVPGSPRDHHNDDGEFAEQVTVCRWAGCNEDLGNMDDLVKHIHDDHIGSRKAKYACEWDGCSRKGMTHASGYALRAHMRSHTREKPFYCSLPECDRSFTRSDALAKHMRTVHETEALRPSDPIPKSHPNHPHNIANTAFADAIFRRQSKSIGTGTGANGDGSFRVLQLNTSIMTPSSSQPQNGTTHHTSTNASTRHDSDSEMENGVLKAPRAQTKSYYPPTDPFSPTDETHHPPKELYKYLKQKLKWAQAEHEQLQAELEGYTKRRREAWIKKELLLERCLKIELGEDVGGVSIFWEKGAKAAAAGSDVGDGSGDDGRNAEMRDLGAAEDADEELEDAPDVKEKLGVSKVRNRKRQAVEEEEDEDEEAVEREVGEEDVEGEGEGGAEADMEDETATEEE